MRGLTSKFPKLPKFLNHPRLLPILILVLSILIAGLIFTIQTDRFFPGLARVKQTTQNLIERVGLRPKSSVEISQTSGDASDSGRLVFKFNILDRDKSNVEQISELLGVKDTWTSGVAINLNSQSLEQLKSLLPIKLNLEFHDREIDFSAGGERLLSSSLPQREYQLATGGGELRIKGSGVTDFDLELVEPGKLAQESNKSGKLYLSKQIGGFVSVLEKVSAIDMKVSDKNINGSIKLK